jgi:hypothetical protein
MPDYPQKSLNPRPHFAQVIDSEDQNIPNARTANTPHGFVS